MTKLDKRAVALFRGKNFAYIATINRNGTPQLTPIWSDSDGKNVLVNTEIGRVKHKNAVRDKRVAISIYDQGNPYSRVSVNGKVVKEITGKKAKDHIDLLALKYTGKKYQDRASAEKRIILVVAPLRVTGVYA